MSLALRVSEFATRTSCQSRQRDRETNVQDIANYVVRNNGLACKVINMLCRKHRTASIWTT
jgi:hypothetical protein